MPREIDRQAAAQKRSSRLLIGMAAFIFLGAAVYGVLLFVTSRRTPADPDTRYTAENGVAVYYESARWPVCRMTEDPALGPVLELASSEDADDDHRLKIEVPGAQVEAVRCDIQAYYAVLATLTYDSGDVIYVSALTRLASINDVLNLIESVTLA